MNGGCGYVFTDSFGVLQSMSRRISDGVRVDCGMSVTNPKTDEQRFDVFIETGWDGSGKFKKFIHCSTKET